MDWMQNVHDPLLPLDIPVQSGMCDGNVDYVKFDVYEASHMLKMDKQYLDFILTFSRKNIIKLSMNKPMWLKTKLFMAAVDQCTQCSDDVLREVCNNVLHMYPSYRLARILKYLLKLQYTVKDFMTSSCKCITWNTERRNLQYVPPRCR
ncbi:Hypothetical predicted protein, partial [Paramuricea clavata]